MADGQGVRIDANLVSVTDATVSNGHLCMERPEAPSGSCCDPGNAFGASKDPKEEEGGRARRVMVVGAPQNKDAQFVFAVDQPSTRAKL